MSRKRPLMGCQSVAEDDRVRCWDCAKRIPRTIILRMRQHDGRIMPVEVRTKACRDGLGYDPHILRRCYQYKPKKAAYKERRKQ